MAANWNRLIRFVAAETSRIHLGQPVDPNIDVGIAAHENKAIKAFEIIGSSPLDPNAVVTDKVLSVKHLIEPIPREDVKIVRCLGLNYSDHAAEANLPPPKFPTLFYKPYTALIGPGVPITIPKAAQPVEEHLPDYEVELTVVIGRDAKNVSESEALDFVLGYTVGNDISFRKHQMAVSQWGFSKGFDDATPFGPSIVSTRAISDPHSIRLRTELNGQTMQDGSTADLIFNVRQTIAFLSQGTTLEAGSLIMTGTPKGVGFVRQPKVFLRHGDDVRCWIDGGMGTLVNPIIEEGRAKL